MPNQIKVEWLDQEWSRFCETPTGQQSLVNPNIDLAGVAKLFAAFCVTRLEIEIQVEEEITGG